MSDLGRLMRALRAVEHEAGVRAMGESADARFDVPLAMLLDLADELEADARSVDARVEELHGGRDVGAGLARGRAYSEAEAAG